jgi:5-(carboxyamino)imidazole ribonucleotide mutase
MSAHRTPHEVMELIKTSENNGCKVFIAAAGMAAHLAGAVAAHSTRPVIGIPYRIRRNGRNGLFAINSYDASWCSSCYCCCGKAGAKNSAILAVQILATSDDGLAAKLSEYKSNMRDEVLKKDQALNS